MSKKKKLKEIYEFCKTKYIDWQKIKRDDLLLIMKLIDKKGTQKLLDEQQDDYNGLLKGE